jgi:MerR family transcriptional regulator, light-induced transcriptional regulator
MRGIRTHAAAVMLGVSPNTLRSWERRYEFPSPHRSPGGHRLYGLTEIEALRTALAEAPNISSAIALARQRGEGPASWRRLLDAFANFDEELANRLLEESLTLRSIERTVEDLMLEALTVLEHNGRQSPEYDFAWRYSTGWLSALKRISPPAQRPDGVLVLDASAVLDLDALHAQALELVLRRAGLRTLALSPSVEAARLGRAMRALRPEAIVLTGRWVSLDVIARVIYAVRGVHNDAAVFDFRGAVPDTGATTVKRLGTSPVAARDRLLEHMHAAWNESPATARRAVLAVRS